MGIIYFLTKLALVFYYDILNKFIKYIYYIKYFKFFKEKFLNIALSNVIPL